ncbi:hypothetical protein ACP70R_012125 [Stipagrostis hirtigluma subsp. patula]
MDAKDSYGTKTPISVHASSPFHEDFQVAKKLGIKAAVLAINAQTPVRYVDFSYLKLRALEQGHLVTTYLTNFTNYWANPMSNHHRVQVSQSLTYILKENVDMIGYDVVVRALQEVVMHA